MMTFEALERSLTNQPPADHQVQRMEDLRKVAKLYAQSLFEFVPATRERSLAITKLEESVMWAIKGIALERPPTTFGSEG